MKRLATIAIAFLLGYHVQAQCPTPGFTFTDDICIEQNVSLTNTSVNAVSYEWDFCVGDLGTAPTGANFTSNAENSAILRPMDMTVVEDAGNYFGFVPNRTGVNILRFDFGTNLSNTPTPVSFTDGEFAQPTAIKFYQESDVWYGLLTDFTKGGNGSLLRLTFGSGIGSAPTQVDDLGRFGKLFRPTDLVLASDTSGVYGFITNSSSSTITRVDFSGSYGNNPANSDAVNINPGGLPWGLEIITECESRYGLVTIPSSNLVRHLSFPDGLGSAPTFTTITTETFTTPYGVDLKDEGTGKYAVVAGQGANLYHFTFSGSYSDTAPVVDDQGDLGVLTAPNAIVLASDSSQWYGFAIDEDNRTLERLTYVNACGTGIFFSTEETPTGINYTTDGTYTIGLTVTDADGDRVATQQSITVTANVGPDISFTVDDNRCVLNDNTFTSSTTSPSITSYSWDFNGEGAASTDVADFDFTSSGEKTVTLLVESSNGCTAEASETITIYDAPPVPNFDFTGSQCVSNDLVFQNLTVDTDWTGVISYDWDFNSEGTSTDRDPTFAFPTDGTKTVSVTSSIPGCTSAAYEENDIEIQASPSPSFSFLGNCGTGVTITFTDESGSSGLTYDWDFGDSNTSMDQNPTHSYTAEGTYTVIFTQTSSNGCSASAEMDLVVSDASLASFTFGAAEVNSNTNFSGVDETPAGDAVTNWSWDFDNDDVEDADTQNPSFAFTTAGTFPVSLTVTTSQGCTEEISNDVNVVVAPCPTPGFTFTDDICIEENVSLTNTSVNAVSYEWDFCVGDLGTAPTGANFTSNAENGDILRPMDMTVVEDAGNYYGFVPNRTGANVLRFDFGTNLSNTPVPVSFTDGEFAQPTAIKFYQESDVWYGLLTDFTKGGNGSLLRLTFGSGIGSAPTQVDDLGRFGVLIRPTDLVLASDTSGVYGFITNSSSSTITRVDFSGSYGNNPEDSDAANINPGGFPWGLEIITECESRYGLVTIPSSNLVRHLSFPDGLGSAPTFTTITTETFTTPYGVDLKDEGTGKYAVVAGQGANLYHFTFSGSYSDTAPVVDDQGDLGVLTAPNAVVLASDSSQWYGFTIDEDNRTLERLTYVNACGAGTFFSTEETPTGINYTSDGTYTIGLTVTDADGDRVATQQSITVTANVGPDISFTIDDNRCVLNDNTFTSNTTSTSITSYSWDFNGEGAASTSVADFDFASSGEKTVTLLVEASNGCTAEATETITIYEAPPVPNFDFTGSQCVSNDLVFQNLTVDTDWVGVISYDWDFNSEGASTDRDPTFAFLTDGTKTVSVTSSIPGCTSAAYEESDIEIQASPSPSFSYLGNCGTGATITFTDESGSSGLTYDWDFGDSNTSMDQNPTHSYTAEGTYTVIFTQTSSNGCSASAEMDLVVSDASLASFTFGAAEVNSNTNFSGVDETPAEDAVTNWSWDFDNDDVEDADTQNASFVFTTEGTFPVSLTVTTSQGCTEEISNDVNVVVAPCPTPGFTFTDDICIEENVSLTNTSVNAVSYEWDFCVGDLGTAPTGANFASNAENSDILRPMDMEVVEDAGNYYGFVPNRTGANVLRFDFGTDLSNTPTPVSFTDGEFAQPTSIKFYQESDVWYGLLTDFTKGGNGSLLRLTFGSGIGSAPTQVDDLGRFGALVRPTDLVLASDTSGVYGFITNSSSSTITRVDFSGSYGNNPEDSDAANVNPGGFPWGLEIITECESRYGLVTLPASNLVRHLSFPDGLGSAPTFTTITTETFASPYGVDLKDEGTGKYAVVAGQGANLYHFTFSGSYSDTAPVVNDQGDLGVLTTPNAVVLVSDSSQWYGFVMDEDNQSLQRLTYVNSCGDGTFFSTEERPTGINYTSDGTYTIGLTVTDADGDRVATQQSITVTANVGPDISFTVDENRCILNDNTFTSSTTSLSITSYSWDFNGEGSASTSVADFDFASSGEKTVTLLVEANNGCTASVSETITIYEAPPVPNFDFTGSQCVSNDLVFQNLTVDTDWAGVISYDWDFNSEGTSTERDPTFAFPTEGTKTVSVTSSIPGCTSAAYEENDIEIQASPSPSFSYLSNCGTGATINFTDESGASGLTYDWDFGDSNTSMDQNPTHSYAAEGTYTVVFTQTSSNGCSASEEMDLVVSDASLASFTFGDAEVNSNTSFNGVDETSSGDAVISWSWDFDNDDVEDANTQNASFVFTTEGTFPVSLTVTTSQSCTEEVSNNVNAAFAPCPTPGFTFTDDICIEENVSLTNTSVNAVSYEWDFCVGDLSTTPTGTNLTSNAENSAILRPMDMTVVNEAGNYYGFVPNRTGTDIIRLDFGTSLSNDPIEVVSLSNLNDETSDSFSQPTAIKFYQDAGTWYALMTDFTASGGNGAIFRLTFGDGLSAVPTLVDNLGTFGVGRPTDLVLASDSSGVYAFVANSGRSAITRIDFDGSYGNNPAEENASEISTSGTLWGLELIEECEDSFYGLFSVPNNNEVNHLSFPNGLGSSPDITSIAGSFTLPYGVALANEGTGKYGLVVGNVGALYQLTFDDSFSDTTPDVVNLEGIDVLITPNSVVLASDGSDWFGFVSDEDSRSLERLTYINDCGGGTLFSTEETPATIKYGSNGNHVISLTAIDSDGDRVTFQDTLTVTTNAAPDISITIDENQCILNENMFSSSSSASIVTYDWDFNGEGSASTSDATFGFTTAGEKTITLEVVAENGCSNQVSESLTTYEAPPVPVFDISGNICESTSLSIMNTTEDDDWSDAISYTWTFDGDSSVTIDQPDFAFTNSGERTVSVISSIPGCASDAASETVIVNSLPNTDYSVSPTCDQEITSFTNLTTGAVSYEWDFGDGFTSTQSSPAHLYAAPGDYMVEMVATNSAGCSDTLAQEFSVDYLPVAGFRAQLPCEGLINLIDTSSVASSDIATWSYSVESIEQLFAEQNPELTLEEPGTYEVTQEVTSSRGCTSSVTQTISVQDAADANMQIDAACFGESFHFTDISSVSSDNRVISRSWNFEGQNVEVADTSIVEIDHVFSAPGTYEVILTLTTQNLCTSTISRTVEVLERPTLAFDVPQICQNDFASFTDLSVATNDDIVSRQWILNDALIGNGSSVSHKFTVDGINEINLVTTTQQGCMDTLTRFVDVLPAPQASFEASDEFGVEGTAFSFSNTSVGSSTYQWLVDGSPVKTTSNLDTIFNVSGNREVSLIAFSEFECSDTTALDVLVRVPEIDVRLTGMRLVPDNENPNFSIIQVSVENSSNLPVDALRFVVEIDDQLPIQNTEDLFVPIGESRTTALGVGVPIQANYICVRVLSTYESEDINPLDNNRCINIEQQPVFPPVYPNPVRDEVSVDAILPSEGDVTISLLDISGKVEIQETYSDLNEGLQSFTLELAPYEPGMYFIRIEYEGFMEMKRIVKQ